MKVGFICEGRFDKILLSSKQFDELLTRLGLQKTNVVFADGAGNLLPRHIDFFRTALINAGAGKVIILTDLDQDACITLTKNRLQALPEEQVIIAVKSIESWFLADSQTLSELLSKPCHIDLPEEVSDPFEALRILFISKSDGGRGVGTKPILARRMIKYGFTIERAATHPNCPSALYFLNKLTEFAQ